MNPNTIYSGDCLAVMAKWPAASVDLVFADPPYNIGYVYDAYRDDRPDAEYVDWCTRWMDACHRVLTPTGSFYLAIGDEFAAELCVAAKQRVGFHLRNWIIWHYTFGQNMRVKFSRSHTHILYFTKDRVNSTFNADLLRFPSARHTEYQDLRADPRGRVPNDVWSEFPRVCGTFKEREGYHGCQLPEALLRRIIMASSNPGDVVLDPFVGSGTTVAVAKRLGRRYLGIDLSQEYVDRSKKRLQSIRDESGAKPDGQGNWPDLHVEHLLQIYRETGVILSYLVRNAVAMRVIANALSARCGHPYAVEEVHQQFERLAARKALPKMPNDTPFEPRKHVTAEGKVYERRVTRYVGRKRKAAGVPGSLAP